MLAALVEAPGEERLSMVDVARQYWRTRGSVVGHGEIPRFSAYLEGPSLVETAPSALGAAAEYAAQGIRDIMRGPSYLKRFTGSTQEQPAGLADRPAVDDKPVGIDPDKEGHPDDLVIEAWAHCTAKAAYSRSQDDYVADASGIAQLRQRHTWRRRTAWIGLDCGEDSFFVSNNRKVIGVADGVGAWRHTNVDPAEIANAMMQHSKSVSEEQRDNLDPEDIMTQAFQKTIESGKVRGGSTTAIIAALETDNNEGKPSGKATGKLHVSNLGDSGLLMWRKNLIRYRAREIQHSFNAPYQLAIIPRKQQGLDIHSDLPSAAFKDTVPVMEDDILIMGTDGLFDNVPNTELAKHCDMVLNTTGDYGGYFTPWTKWSRNNRGRAPAKDVVPNIVANAVLNAKSKTFMTPFSYALLENGVASAEEAKGGKPDDVTVILARVVRRGNWRESKGVAGGESGSIRDVGAKFAGYTNKPNFIERR